MRLRTTSLSTLRLVRAIGLSLVVGLAAWPAAGAVLWYEHYANGLTLEQEGEWRDAADAFVEASRVNARPRERIRTYGLEYIFDYDPAFHLARCYVELALPVEAREQLEAAEEAGVTAAAELSALRGALEDLELEQPPPRETHGAPAAVRVDSKPPAAVVILDGLMIGTTPLASLEIKAGFHHLSIEAPGYLPWNDDFQAGSDEQIYINAELRPVISAIDDGEVAAPTPEATVGRRAGAAASPTEPTPADQVEGEEGAGVGMEEGAELDREPVSGQPGAAAPDRSAWWALWIVLLVGVLVGPVVAGIWWLLQHLEAAVDPVDRTITDGRLGPTAGRVAGYQAQTEIGRGGMATTYRAYRLSDGRSVALKIPHDSGDATYAERFVREGRLGERLHHPGIVRILEAGEEAGLPYMAMELLPGRTLKSELAARSGRLELARALEVATGIAEALDYAHGKGVVHRDLKPENIMILPDGTLKVMDFGVARISDQPGLTSSHFFFGSPLYAAPEVTQNPRSVDYRADLYSLGILLFEIALGQPPFVHESVFRVLEMHQSEPLPGSDEVLEELPEAVWTMIRKLCEKDPDKRYGSAQEVLVELNQLLFELT